MVARRVASSIVRRQVKYVTPVPVVRASGLVSIVYDQVADEMRIVIPPALLHSPAPDVLAAYWMLAREPLMPAGTVDRAVKEAVATAVAVANICPYCVDMHSVGLYELSTEHDAEAIATDRAGDVTHPWLREVASWARVAHQPDAVAGRNPPFPASARPELVGVLVSLHYLTRMVNVFLTPFLLPPGLTQRSRRRLKHGLGGLLGPMLRGSHRPGRSVGLLPAAELPPGAAWAAGNDAVAAATARSYATFEAAGARALSPEARELVRQRVLGWRGEETGLGRGWCEALVADLAEADRAGARLALLTALASYQVDHEVVNEFQRWHPDDARLVDVAAWGSYLAAARVGSWYGSG